MKKLLCVALCLALALTFFACGEDTDAVPVISIDESGIASWQEIKGAKGYEYKINDGDVVSVSADVTSLQLISKESIQVRAVFKNSVGEWSEVAVCLFAKTLPTPVLKLKAIGGQILVSWEVDKNAVSYEYTLNGSAETPILSTSFLINATDTFRLRAKGDGEVYLDSGWASSKAVD